MWSYRLFSQHSRVHAGRTDPDDPAPATTSFFLATISACFNTNVSLLFRFPHSHQPLTPTASGNTAPPSSITDVLGCSRPRYLCLFFHEPFCTFSGPFSSPRNPRQRCFRYRCSPPHPLLFGDRPRHYCLRAGQTFTVIARPVAASTSSRLDHLRASRNQLTLLAPPPHYHLPYRFCPRLLQRKSRLLLCVVHQNKNNWLPLAPSPIGLFFALLLFL